MRKLLAPLFVIVLVAGCVQAPVPETPRERLVAFEATYQGALGTVNDLIDQGVIAPASPTAQRVGAAIYGIEATLETWRAFPDNREYMTASIAALRALQTILTQLQHQAKGQGA